jgi:hypothetical protein
LERGSVLDRLVALSVVLQDTFVMDAVPVFVDYTKSAEDIESIVDTPLHILEVHIHIPVLVYLKDSLGYLGTCSLPMIHHFFKHFFG